jgi:hypothetical protein
MRVWSAGATTFDFCRFRCVTALALTSWWKPSVFAINICGFFAFCNIPAFGREQSYSYLSKFESGSDVIAIWPLGGVWACQKWRILNDRLNFAISVPL